MDSNLKLYFFGGAQEVTGACYLLEAEDEKILIDCGLFQGLKINEDKNYEPFGFNPKEISAVLVTHAHLDHVGRIPKLFKEGFRNKIFSTPPTRPLAKLILLDSLGVMEKEMRKDKRDENLYEEADINKAIDLWEIKDYHQDFRIGEFEIVFKDAGHILGSSIIEVKYKNKKIVFTGDLGNPPNPLLKDTEKIIDADYLIIESTYGDKTHEKIEEANLKLERIIEDNVHKQGVLMIPALSLERTQKILFEINNLVENGRIPRVSVFLDSPLAIKATEIYKKYQNYFNENAKEIILSGDELFVFPGLKNTLSSQESKKINNVPPPKIIIAGSAMSNGGRILHHEYSFLPDDKNTLLLISYQAVGSLGRFLEEGAKSVNIFGENIPVRAAVEKIQGYSAHPDINGLTDFAQNTADSLKKVFVVQGEPKTSLFFVQRLKDCLCLDAVAPKLGESFELQL
ncbi:MAG: MBL fold metallo-hydrolase [Patescibacteria group bacterium]